MLNIIPTWVKIVVLGIIFAAGCAEAYHLGFQSSEVHAQKQTIQQLNDAQTQAKKLQKQLDDKSAALRTTSKRLQDALANLTPQAPTVRYVYKTITKEVENPVYKQCIIPASGMSVINANASKLNQLRKP